VFKTKKDLAMEESEFANELGAEILNMLTNIRQMVSGNDGGETYLFPIEFGSRQLIIFVLPGLNDDVQKRFNRNWYATLQMLSWLTRVGGKEGPYYYLSVPKAKQLIQGKAVLVINGEEFQTDLQLRLHSIYKEIVPRLSESRSKDGFKHQMMVAERVQKDPIGQLSDELRYWMAEGKLSSERRDRLFKVYGNIHDILEMEGKIND